ncbi:tyrosine-type recombinase/integrase [Sphingobium sp. H39-3-25]|uniref:site-specific integrase n=1 Tax=Sphingobium arseniciresistens TaxID=3030834 RepID=UPI0023B9D6F8|nr:tyrosine-type recombinase/integrase [Sphingobium arseniciresistens]
MARLFDLYMDSAQFQKLRPSSQRQYQMYLGQFADNLGPAPASQLERKDVLLLLDKRARTAGAANMLLAIGRAVWSWGRKRGHVSNNPFDGIDAMDMGEHQPWPDALVKQALESDDGRIRLVVHLLYYTAQRIGDVAALAWRDIDGDKIVMTQQKTGKTLVIPMHADLAAELARHPRSLATILNVPLTKSGLHTIRKPLQDYAAARGHKVVPHGLRKNAVNALLEAGCSAAETAAISGQSLQMVEHYSKGRSQAKLGRSAILKWQRNKA